MPKPGASGLRLSVNPAIQDLGPPLQFSRSVRLVSSITPLSLQVWHPVAGARSPTVASTLPGLGILHPFCSPGDAR